MVVSRHTGNIFVQDIIFLDHIVDQGAAPFVKHQDFPLLRGIVSSVLSARARSSDAGLAYVSSGSVSHRIDDDYTRVSSQSLFGSWTRCILLRWMLMMEALILVRYASAAWGRRGAVACSGRRTGEDVCDAGDGALRGDSQIEWIKAQDVYV